MSRDSMSPPLEWHRFRIPLRVAFRGVRVRTGSLVRGPYGWGEYSPFPGYSDGELDRCRQSAIDSATRPWPAARRTEVPVHVTVPALEAEDAARLVAESGCRAAKVKVADGDDFSRVEAVRQVLGPRATVTVDANGAWSPAEAERSIRRLEALEVALVEQPVAGAEEMARLRRRIDTPIAADELVTSAEAARRLTKAGAADVLVLKVQSLGGIEECLRIVEECAVPVVVSNLIETSVGLAAGLALAAAVEELRYPCGLGTALLLSRDVTADPLVPVAGVMEVRRPEVDAVLLARVAPLAARGRA